MQPLGRRLPETPRPIEKATLNTRSIGWGIYLKVTWCITLVITSYQVDHVPLIISGRSPLLGLLPLHDLVTRPLTHPQ